MADVAADLQTSLESLVAAYKAACANPKPTYSIGGQSVQWADYLKTLADQIKQAQELIGLAAPFELRSAAIP